MVTIDVARDKKGNRIHVDDALSGEHDYSCLRCGEVLVAKKGDINDWHFSHKGERNCAGESILHMEVVKAAAELDSMTWDNPPCEILLEQCATEYWYPQYKRRFDVWCESVEYRSPLLPDRYGHSRLAIEIHCSNKKDRSFIAQMATHDVAVLEVDIDPSSGVNLSELLRQMDLVMSNNARWLVEPRYFSELYPLMPKEMKASSPVLRTRYKSAFVRSKPRFHYAGVLYSVPVADKVSALRDSIRREHQINRYSEV